ncbi:MAG TPA: hypothetical protein VLV55_10870 [Rhizomicrobium sp.]|nr:hypothetical protein [Rhizomicrobium sp.]
MDRYHIIKVSIVALAIIAAVAGMDATQGGRHASASTQSHYSAAIQLQETAWRATTCFARSIAHALLRY